MSPDSLIFLPAQPKISANIKPKPNITKNSLLIINRTSKGGLGEFVGISIFYDVSKFGHGRCNQGFYYVNNYSETELKFFAAFLNSDLMRIYCGRL